jgi:hypothetical protein
MILFSQSNKEIHMPPKIPYELARCKQQIEAAWKTYDDAVESGATYAELTKLAAVANAFEAEWSILYSRWQELGGTSDIETLTALEYGQADLGTHWGIIGGEAVELDGYRNTVSDDDMPF